MLDDAIPPAKRIVYLDVGRGLAMLMVVIGHIFQPQLFGQEFRYALFAVHLPLFLLISGILYKERPFLSLLKKSFLKILIPYIVGVLLILIFYFVSQHQGLLISWKNISLSKIGSISKILVSAFIVNGGDYYLFAPKLNIVIGAIWYLVGYFEVLILFKCILLITKRLYLQVGIISLLTLTGYMIGSHTALPLQILSSFVMLPFFASGYYSKNYWLNRNSLENKKVILFIVLLGIILWYLSASNGILLLVSAQATQGPVLATISGIFSSIALLLVIRILIDKHLLIGKQFLSKFGQLSLYVLVVHDLDLTSLPVTWIIMDHLNRSGINPQISNIIVMPISVLFAFTGAYLLNKLLSILQTNVTKIYKCFCNKNIGQSYK
ncbi:acyltransferase family protein [Leuconostoc mesenteroides]|uniref:acyltransferase family protein n=1 Tax=Leuconostoc mesenteroides TaxID=1245 RepID=UPI00235EB6CA|nr:acyltransferase family protein [Leuconostoc mesenteroides]